MSQQASRILHVDDDEDDAFAVADAFAQCNVAMALDWVESGQKAVTHLQTAITREAKEALPRLILLDLNMPVMTGHQFLQWRMQQPAFKRIPVLVLTSSDSATDIALALQTGASGYVVKPSRRTEMALMIHDLAAFWLRWTS